VIYHLCDDIVNIRAIDNKNVLSMALVNIIMPVPIHYRPIEIVAIVYANTLCLCQSIIITIYITCKSSIIYFE